MTAHEQALARLRARQRRELEEIERMIAADVPMEPTQVARAVELRAVLLVEVGS